MISSGAWAHPVIYKGGTVYWGTFMPQMNIQRLSYSFTSSFALEFHTQNFRSIDSYRDYQLGANVLLKKWLFQNSQGNLYLGGYAGYFNSNLTEGMAYHAMAMGDWESRNVYTAASVDSYFYSGDSAFRYSYRLGLAPYNADMGELQSWLVFKIDYFKKLNTDLMVTPMLRFFYRNVLWEIGSSLSGDIFLTLMVHY